MSDSNRAALRIARKESDGTPITPAGDMDEMLFNNESLNQETSSANSEQIRDDRQIADHIRTAVAVAGDINWELSYAAFDNLFEAALQSVAWTSPVADIGPVTTIEALVTVNELRITTDGGFATLSVGQWILISGFVASGNNDYARIDEVTDFDYGGSEINNVLVLSQITLATEAAGASITIESSEFITNGTRMQLIDVEREYKDLTTEFAFFTDLSIDTMEIQISASDIVKGSFSFQGKTESSETATAVSGTLNAAAVNPIMNAVDNVPRIVEGGGVVGFASTALTIAIANNLRGRAIIGSLAPDSHGSGTCEVSGTLSAFFEDKTVVDKHLNFTKSELWVLIQDTNGARYIIEIPQVNYNASPRGSGGQNQDIVMDMGFAATREATKGYTIRIHRFAA